MGKYGSEVKLRRELEKHVNLQGIHARKNHRVLKDRGIEGGPGETFISTEGLLPHLDAQNLVCKCEIWCPNASAQC